MFDIRGDMAEISGNYAEAVSEIFSVFLKSTEMANTPTSFSKYVIKHIFPNIMEILLNFTFYTLSSSCTF